MKILLIISGSVAACKSLELIRILRKHGADVTCVLTKGGREFVTPLSCAALSGNKVYEDIFSLQDETEMGHINLSRQNDLIIIAPASANVLAKMASGIADDLASTLLLAADKPILVAPAMNVKMWENPATKRNIAQLKEDGIYFIGPDEGSLACGEEGGGRMSKPEEIYAVIKKMLEEKKLLFGRKILVTSGPTREKFDPVRYISNYSSGKQGHEIAAALENLGADVTLVSGPVSIPDPEGVTTLHAESADDMLKLCEKNLPVDVAICVAAVSDWRVENIGLQKIKKAKKTPSFSLVENPDILQILSKHSINRPKLVIGFAAETENTLKNAREKLKKKECDWILANDVSGGQVFGNDRNTINFITLHGDENWPSLMKKEVAEKLAIKIAEHFKQEYNLKLAG